LTDKILKTIEYSRNFFEGYIIPRLPNKPTIIADETNSSIHNLYQLVNYSKYEILPVSNLH